jgi:hypothetical protein
MVVVGVGGVAVVAVHDAQTSHASTSTSTVQGDTTGSSTGGSASVGETFGSSSGSVVSSSGSEPQATSGGS